MRAVKEMQVYSSARVSGSQVRNPVALRFFFASSGKRATIRSVNFLVHHVLPIFQYLFLAGLIGAVPVIIITAIKTAQSMLEDD